MNAAVKTTPCGRLPGTPLPGRREQFCQEIIAGQDILEAFRRAGFSRTVTLEDGSKIALADIDLRDLRLPAKEHDVIRANARRLRNEPVVQERINELAAKGAELAEIYDAWLLEDAKLFTRANSAHFYRRKPDGSVELNEHNLPVLDFSRATERQMRVIKSFRHTRYGPMIEVFDPREMLTNLMRHRGLLKDRGAGDDGSLTIVVKGGLPDFEEAPPVAPEGAGGDGDGGGGS